MKKKLTSSIEKYRVKVGPYASTHEFGMNGIFKIKYKKMQLNVMISDQGGWDHVSVSVNNKNRTPTWNEMCFIKDIFFEDNEMAIQYHPSKSDYINTHPFVLHLWRPQGNDIIMPPNIFV